MMTAPELKYVLFTNYTFIRKKTLNYKNIP